MIGSQQKKQQRFGKSFWFALHGWLALPIWGLLALICITGTLCVVSEEITWLISPKVRAENPHQYPALPFDKLITTVTQTYPDAKIESIHITQPYLANYIRISLLDGGRKNLYVNQYTGTIQGEVKGLSFRSFIIALHGWLLFPWQNDYSIGWYLVTAVSIPLLGSLISGIIIFKHFYRLLYRPKLRLSMGSRVFWGDLHRLLAAWSIWFVLTMSISGLWFLVQGVLEQNHIDIYPAKVQLNESAIPATPDATAPKIISVDEAVSIAKTIYPTLQVTYIEFPENLYSGLMIQGSKRFSLLRDNVNSVSLNPYTGELVSARSTNNLSLTQFLSAALTPLHFGDFAGLTSKLIWFFFGCLLSILVCTGFIIWSKRTVTTSLRKAISNKKLKST